MEYYYDISCQDFYNTREIHNVKRSNWGFFIQIDDIYTKKIFEQK